MEAVKREQNVSDLRDLRKALEREAESNGDGKG